MGGGWGRVALMTIAPSSGMHHCQAAGRDGDHAYHDGVDGTVHEAVERWWGLVRCVAGYLAWRGRENGTLGEVRTVGLDGRFLTSA